MGVKTQEGVFLFCPPPTQDRPRTDPGHLSPLILLLAFSDYGRTGACEGALLKTLDTILNKTIPCIHVNPSYVTPCHS